MQHGTPEMRTGKATGSAYGATLGKREAKKKERRKQKDGERKAVYGKLRATASSSDSNVVSYWDKRL